MTHITPVVFASTLFRRSFESRIETSGEIFMSRNPIQMQVGMSLDEFHQTFPDEQSCQQYLENLKWPQGFQCRRCQGNKSWVSHCGVRGIPRWQCADCDHQESLLSGTLFQHTRLPLRTWFLAIELLTQAKTCLSALELHRLLGVNDKTALLMKHKIMAAATESECRRVLSGRIELDDVYLGGVREGGKAGRGAEGKTPFLAAVATDEGRHPLYTVLTPVEAFSKKAVEEWSRIHLSSSCKVLTDGLSCFEALDDYCVHQSYNMAECGKAVADTRFKWVNTVISNVKSAFGGALHAFDFKSYGARYLGFMQFRFNHRFDLRKCFHQLLFTTVKTGVKTKSFLQQARAG